MPNSRFALHCLAPPKFTVCAVFLPLIGADFWEGDATKHFSVNKKGFSVKGGRQFSEWGVW